MTTPSPALFLNVTETFSQDWEQFLIQIKRIYTDISRTTNLRDISIYDLTEINDGQQWFTLGNPQVKRFDFRKVFQTGAIAPGATLVLAHGILTITTPTFINGVATTAADFRPIPYSSVTAVTNQIEINVDAVNINITNGATAPAIVSAIIVIEFLKN